MTATLVGLVVFANRVAHDDVDRYPTYVLVTPALTAAIHSEYFPTYSISLAHGSADVSLVEREVLRYLPLGSVYQFHVTSVVADQVERATRPESIALAVFGLIALAAALLVGAQALRREVWSRRTALEVARALGADRVTRVVAMTAGALFAVVLGTLVAVAVAIALSPLAPLGAVRQVDPNPGVAFDSLVLVVGAVLLVVALGTAAIAVGVRAARPPSSDAGRSRRSRVAEAASRAGLPSPVVTGLRFSLAADSSADGAPVRSALLASVLAVAVVVTTVTFASGLSTLDSHPALYGWNWSSAILAPNGTSVPPAAGTLLSRDPDVAAWTPLNFANAQIDGVTVPIILTPTHAAVGPAAPRGPRGRRSGSGRARRGDACPAAPPSRPARRRELRDERGLPRSTCRRPRSRSSAWPRCRRSGFPATCTPPWGSGRCWPRGSSPRRSAPRILQPDDNLDGPTMDVVRLRTSV